jgi:16S rRNA (guanine966-N2)-methyltransferase
VRIINGIHKGRVIRVPKGLPVRPTTDFAKEGLFNILTNKIDFEAVKFLDLFSGTGHISLEFASRGCKHITSVDKNFQCAAFLKTISKELGFDINTVKGDVFDFLKKSKTKYDFIFADPPYDITNVEEIHYLVFEKDLLNENGTLIIEHGPRTDLSSLKYFSQHRKYGNVNFTFFEKNIVD